MKAFIRNVSRVIPVVVLLGAGNLASAHPGAPGHTHFPDEVDEFEQVAMAPAAASNQRDYNLGGIIVLFGIAGCLGFAFFQKQGGIWKDATIEH